DPRPMGHFGLALKDYTHFTSPIRRYPDLVVHRALKLLIGRGKGTDKRYEDAELEKLGLETSRQERTAMEAERFVVKRKQCHFMSERIGDEFDAQVSSAGPEGLFIAIPKFAIEGFLPIEA